MTRKIKSQLAVIVSALSILLYSQVLSADPNRKITGPINNWLSDGSIELRVNSFEIDWSGPSSSPVKYYRVKFTVKNLTKKPIELEEVKVQFTTSDGGFSKKPFQNTIGWSSNLGNPRHSGVTKGIRGSSQIELQSSGHFFFGKENPSVTISLHNSSGVFSGPFVVLLGPTLPRR